VLDRLKGWLEEARSKSKDQPEEGNYILALDRMKDPARAKATVRTITVPPGAPIGCEDEAAN
jgi:hypothetical protein